MISSVIARLAPDTPCDHIAKVTDAIESREGVEVGDLIDGHLLPITIEASGQHAMKTTTSWLQELEGVLFVDVVYVHFEELDSPANQRFARESISESKDRP